MKASKKLSKQYEALRSLIIAEISLAIKLHNDIEVEPEFKKPISFAAGGDEQDEHQLIEYVDLLKVTIYHQGNEVGTEKYENLSTNTLLEILAGLEESLEDAKK